MIYITAIRLSVGTRIEHITEVKWLNGQTGKAGQTTRESMIDFIEKGNNVQVGGEDGPALVEVVHAQRPYLRTRADDETNDNLLELPRF